MDDHRYPVTIVARIVGRHDAEATISELARQVPVGRIGELGST